MTDAEKSKVKFLLQGMALMGYDAINLADKDLQYGLAFLEEAQETYDLPFISANVYRKDNGQRVAPAFLIKEAGDTKIGILGVTTTSVTPLVLEEFEIKDPVTAVKKTLAELKDKCDVVIALSHLGLIKSKELAETVPGIDFVLSGHRWDLSRAPEMVGDSFVMQPGSKGKYLGHIDFDFISGAVDHVSGRTVSLSSSIEDDPELANLVHKYDESSESQSSGTH